MATLPIPNLSQLEAELEEEDELGELPYFERKQSDNSARRISLCAEVDTFSNLDALELETVEKTKEQEECIMNVMKQNILFSGCDQDELQYIMDTMFEKNLTAGEVVIEQGAEGDNFYVVDQGVCDIYVRGPNETEGHGTHVFTAEAGASFGELALMYNCPRAATVVAQTDCRLWAMDRLTFRRILMDATMVKRTLYESFLEGVPMLNPLNKYERLVVADALKGETWEDGDLIIKQGEEGNAFYIVEEGGAVCTRSEGDSEAVEVKKLAAGDYFGELSLLTNQPRAANVIAVGKLKTVRLSRDAFTRLLGPCEDLLKRGMDEYEAINSQMFSGAEEAFQEDDLIQRLDKMELMATAFLEEIMLMRKLVKVAAKNVRRQSYEMQQKAAEAAVQAFMESEAEGSKSEQQE
eukprot:TRINITY_DN880_c1_g2_i4.p1 TRINITY_DN880_c1_g2~~TRINITY_DN880_c1_g2_i4.p1  ORF type:complete len:408 (+),score=145.68 TRINITY_DN880_c1_g2_i4:188-1411(+)